MREIPLTQGKIAIIDDDDYPEVSKHKWFAHFERIKFYVTARINGKIIRLHRFIMKPNSNEQCDHINSDGLDNRKSNLRIATNQQNQFNRKKQKTYNHKPVSSKYKGVYKLKSGKWRSRISINRKGIHLGYFDSEEDAAKAYDAKAIEVHGEYVKTNFVGRYKAVPIVVDEEILA